MHGCTEAAHTEVCELTWVPGWSFIAEGFLNTTQAQGRIATERREKHF